MLKYSLGLDISAKEIHVCISVIDKEQHVMVKSSRKIDNTPSGFANLHEWVEKNHKHRELPLVVSMEATGSYYENCAIYLHKKGYKVSVILPNAAKNYLKSLGLKSKNDKIDAQGLARMGAEQALELWEPITEYYYQLRCLTRQHEGIQDLKINISNQLHADQYGMYINDTVNEQLGDSLKHLDKQLKAIDKAIETHLATDAEVIKKVGNIGKIKGVGVLTIATIIAETNGFASFKNAPQVVSYAGYDIIENQSGSHKGNTKISKQGNNRMRRILFMPAFSVITCKEKPFLDLYERTLKKHNIKMKSYVAVQKKILIIIYALWKNNEEYDPKYGKVNTKDQELVPPLGKAA